MSSESWVQSVSGALERANPAHPSCAASEDQAAAAARAGACGPLTCIPATADRKAASSWHHSWSPYISFKILKAWERGRLAVSVAASQFGFGGLHLDYALSVVRIAGIQPAPLLEKGRSSLSKNHKSVKRTNDSTEKKGLRPHETAKTHSSAAESVFFKNFVELNIRNSSSIKFQILA